MASVGDSKSLKQNTAEQNSATIGKNIAEVKKKILLCEGQKKAYQEDWEEEKKLNSERITELKKTIKELTTKMTYLNRPNVKTSQPTGSQSSSAGPSKDLSRKVELPPGAENLDQALHLNDLKVIDLKKQIDLNHDRYIKRQKFFNKLVEEYQILFASKNKTKRSELTAPMPETVEEDYNSKLICHLENEIHRTNVQWMEAEHIRKKYRSIKASLMNDSENFESNLLELEQAIQEQETEMKKLQEIYQEALEMRDSSKVVLQKQEQQANISIRIREKQAMDFRRQVEERKLELERLERKIFSTGKTLVHQDSVGSGSGEPQTGQTEHESDPNAQALESTNAMETTFRNIMEATGATETGEVLGRFLAQREATTRLGYLRTVTEATKKDLEDERESLTAQLDAFRFADIKENEVNQEEVEKLKGQIQDQIQRQTDCELGAEHTRKVVGSIKDHLLDLLLKLREIDELTEKPIMGKVFQDYEFGDLNQGDISSFQLLKMLHEALKLGLVASGQTNLEVGNRVEDELADELEIKLPLQSPSSMIEGPVATDLSKPTSFPPCYINLMTNRGTGAITANSPGQANQTGASDDEGDVPSRQYLKRQAQLIIDSKSRRKGGFRAMPRKK